MGACHSTCGNGAVNVSQLGCVSSTVIDEVTLINQLEEAQNYFLTLPRYSLRHGECALKDDEASIQVGMATISFSGAQIDLLWGTFNVGRSDVPRDA